MSTTFVSLDFETTGILPSRHRVIEIGLVRFSVDLNIIEEFSTLINPGRDVGKTNIHGITPTMLAGAPTFAEVAPRICAFLNESVLVAHNKMFDLGFLAMELQRAGITPPELDALCTIELIRSAYPSCPRRLLDAYRHLGFESETAHEALADAKMAAQIAITILTESGFPALPTPVSLPVIADVGELLLKTRSSHDEAQPHSFLADLVAKLPETTLEAGSETIAANEYLNLLDRVIEDRIIEDDEATLLTMVAGNLGLSAGAVRMLHSSYLYALCRSARADGQVTDSERRDIQLVAEALGLEEWENLLAKDLDEDGRAEQADRSVPVGTRVCFTGEMDLSRSECEEHAIRKGLVVCPRVTKDLEILVVADPRTQSTKAQKARKYGVRIMSERAFFNEISRYPNVDIGTIKDSETRTNRFMVEIDGSSVPFFALERDPVETLQRELVAGFADMLHHVKPSLLERSAVEIVLNRLLGSLPELAASKMSVDEACQLARDGVLDLWSHIRAVAETWQEPTPSMIGSFDRLHDLTSAFLARSQAIVEARTDKTLAREEIIEVIGALVDRYSSYEPQVHNSQLYLRERSLKESGVIPNNLLAGVTLVISGDFPEFERGQADQAIRDRGGISTQKISGRTYALIRGANFNYGTQIDAFNADIPIVGYEELLAILDLGELPGVPRKSRTVRASKETSTQDVIETFTCETCGREFSRTRTKGRKPHECPTCRGVSI
jgi:DNA polymerase-3 subunit epsilon